MVKEIQLANNKGVVLVDNEDYEMLMQYSWHLLKKYAASNIKINNEWKTKYIHQLIIDTPKGMEIDHIDNNGLNNQKSNLRTTTHANNSLNKLKFPNCISKHKGVSWDKARNKWIAQILINKKNSYLGTYLYEEDAARAYNKKAEQFHGEYAKLNDICISDNLTCNSCIYIYENNTLCKECIHEPYRKNNYILDIGISEVK